LEAGLMAVREGRTELKLCLYDVVRLAGQS
jgi:hypothetical protein